MKKYLIYMGISFMIVACAKQQTHKEMIPTPEHILKARDHFSKGMFFELEDKHENALIEYYQALLYDSSSAAIYNRIAENHMALNRYESALRYLQKSQRMSPNQPETIRLIADCHYLLKNDDKAIEHLKKVLEIDPFDENARGLLLLLYRKKGDLLALAGQYEEMIMIYGEDEDWVRRAATIYMKNGRLDDALALFKTYIKSDSNNAAMWYSVGTVHEMKDEPLPAIEAYARAVQIAPKVTEAAERLYALCRSEQRWQQLIDIFTPFIETPHANIYRLAIADAYISKEEKDYRTADQVLSPIFDQANVPWQAYDLKGRSAWGQQNYQDALDSFQHVIDLNIKNRIGWIFKGFVLSDMDSLEAAERHYSSGLDFLPEDPFLLTFHGVALQRLDRDEQAVEEFTEALIHDSSNVTALVSMGISLDRLGREDEAISYLEQALHFESDNYTALSTLGMLYDELKMYTQCDRLYEQALQLYPDNPLFLNNYAYSLAERGERLKYALEMAQKAVAAEPDNSAYQDTIGWVYYMLGNYDLALFHIQKSVASRQESAVVIEHLGDVYHKMGKVTEAKSHWKRALEIDHGNERLKLKIEKTNQDM